MRYTVYNPTITTMGKPVARFVMLSDAILYAEEAAKAYRIRTEVRDSRDKMGMVLHTAIGY